MSNRVVQFQRAQLLALSGGHFLADLFSNVLPPILPAVRQHFHLTLFEGSVLVVVLLLTSNWFQLVAGHLRARKDDRLFLYTGLTLAACITGIGLVPVSARVLWPLCGLATVTGVGIAMVHPDSLRAIHTLNRITPAATTAVFMASGFAGFAVAGWVSTVLVAHWDLKGLLPLAVCPLASILAIKLLRVRPAVESEGGRDEPFDPRRRNLPFWTIMVMAIPAAVSTTVVGTLLPTRLVDELGFELTFGGVSATVYGLGGALGSILWAHVAHHKGDLKAMVWAFLLVVPCLGLYLVTMASKAAILLLFGVGFFSFSAFILIVTLARTATGVNLSMRMALIVGGTWGISNLVFLPLARLAEVTGTGLVLSLTPIGYLVAATWGLVVWRGVFRSNQSGD